MPSTRANLMLVGMFASLALVVVCFAGFSLYPFLLLAALFSAGAGAAWRQEKRMPRVAARWANLLCLLSILNVCLLLVAATGGVGSKFMGILYVPIFLAALFYSIPGSTGVGAAVSTFLLVAAALDRSASAPAGREAALTLSGVFLFVSLIAGIFSQGLTYSARQAARRAHVQQRRATEFEWFRDTSTMMESLRDLKAMLSAGLMQLEDLLPCETAAIYLRETEGLQMKLEEFITPSGTPPTKTMLSLDEQEPIRSPDFGPVVAFWPDTKQGRFEMGAFRQIDPNAGSMMAVSLRTMDDMFGTIVVGAREPNVFTERHRELFFEFARHVVYPILRFRLHALATTDTLTGLNNHRAFRRRLQEEVERSQRYRHPLSLILIDLDNFKRVNDTQGHPAGDAILAQVGNILRRGSRGTDMIARYGGEEIVVLCPETRPDEALILAERIREKIANNAFGMPTGGEMKITISLGVAAIPAHGLDAEGLIEAADQALYDAKSQGRNRVCAASPAGVSASLKAR